MRRERRSDHILFFFGEIQRENMKEVVMCVELENEKIIVYIHDWEFMCEGEGG